MNSLFITLLVDLLEVLNADGCLCAISSDLEEFEGSLSNASYPRIIELLPSQAEPSSASFAGLS